MGYVAYFAVCAVAWVVVFAPGRFFADEILSILLVLATIGGNRRIS